MLRTIVNGRLIRKIFCCGAGVAPVQCKRDLGSNEMLCYVL